jgi:hypothetical protein
MKKYDFQAIEKGYKDDQSGLTNWFKFMGHLR